MTESQNPAPTVVRCEVHSLLYDPTQSTGCVLCRREAGEPAQVQAPTPSADNPIGKALAVTAALIVAMSLGLFTAHESIVEMFSGNFFGAAFNGESVDLGGGLSSEDLSKAGVDPRLEMYLEEIEKLDEIEAKRYGTSDEDYENEAYGNDEYDDGYGEDEYDDGY